MFVHNVIHVNDVSVFYIHWESGCDLLGGVGIFGRINTAFFLKAANEMGEISIARAEASLGYVRAVFELHRGKVQAAICEIVDKASLGILGKEIGQVLWGDMKLLRHRL